MWRKNVMSARHEAHSTVRPHGSVILAAILAMAALWATDAAAQGSCVVNRATVEATPDCARTESKSFVNIPHEALNITVGGTAPTCVIVAFSAQAETTSEENMNVRAHLVGIGIGEPEDVTFGAGSGTLEARATQFLFANVPPGNYTLRMQFRSQTGTNVKICEPTVVVHHR
jgi:hypothetical protein